MKIEKSKIMKAAWTIARRESGNISEALFKAWMCAKINAARIQSAKAAAGIAEECDTWKGWQDKGYEVKHGSKALFGCELIYGSKGDGEIYSARFFGASQVKKLA